MSRERDIRTLIANAKSEARASEDAMFEELKEVRSQLLQATRINAVLVALFGDQLDDEHWKLEVERRRVEDYPWENVSLRVGTNADRIVLDLRRNDDAQAQIGGVDIPKTGI